MAEATMKCRICGCSPTIKSHLIPEAFVREIFFSSKADEKHMLVFNEKDYKAPSTTGRYERGLLCGPCDNVLGAYEQRALLLLKKLRLVVVGTKVGTNSDIKVGTYPFRVEKTNDLIRFACGILWKYASLESDNPAAINLGDYSEALKKICFEVGPIPGDIDVFLERDLLSFAAFDDPHDVYYYTTPSVGLREGRKMAWFSVGGFIIYVQLDGGGVSSFAPSECWMRGRKKCHFNVAMRSLQTNRGIVDSIQTAEGDLSRLNRKLRLPTRDEQRRS